MSDAPTESARPPRRALPVRALRPDDPAEVDRVYEICLRTGAAGEDASAEHDDPRLLGDVWAGPYVRYAPDLAFVLEHPDDGLVGYVLGVADTAAFEDWERTTWWPGLRGRHPLDRYPAGTPAAATVARIHRPERTPPDVVAAYPAHLHVDLLPAAQGGGNGRRLLETLFDALRRRGARGVHLGVAAENVRAQGFYEHLGFRRLPGHGHTYGLPLTKP